MTSRVQRREIRQIGALVQAAGVLMLLAVFAIGGLEGLALIPALLFWALITLLCGGLCWLVWNTGLLPAKRFGICVIVFGGYLTGLWAALRAPRTWPEVQATVTAITAPPCTVKTDYLVHAPAGDVTVTVSKEWRSSVDARRSKPGPAYFYANPRDSRQLTERAMRGWTLVQGIPTAIRVHDHGTFRTKVQFGYLFSPRTAEFEGPPLGNVSVGSRLPIYVDPVTRNNVSLATHPTEGGQEYPMLVCALTFVISGVGLLSYGRQWLQPAPPMSCLSTPGIASAAGSAPSVGKPVRLNAREQLKKIDWRQFERVSARILSEMEWQVTLSGGAKPDGGADIVARKNGETAVVQCKHWKYAQVQLKVVRELLGTKVSAGFAAHEAVLFALGTLTEEAAHFARENKITVFDGEAVVRLVEEIGVENFPELLEPDRKLCPKCDAPMVLRRAARPFWGCTTYPRCRGVIEIDLA